MVSVEGLRRTGKYIKNVASRSVGIEQYKQYGQQANAFKKIDHLDKNIADLQTQVATVCLTLAPATFSLLLKEYKSEDTKIWPKFVAGVKLLSGLGIDLSPLVTLLAVEAATSNALYFLGLLGKPLLNAMVHMTSDAIEARAFKRKDLPRATPGTYNLLQEAYDESYDPHLKIGVIKDTQGGVKAVIRREGVCTESGGSCMVLYTPLIEGGKKRIGYAHVTEKDVVANIGASTGGQSDHDIQPNMEELIVNLQKPEPTASG